MKQFHRLIVVALTIAASCTANANRPNILLIVADDPWAHNYPDVDIVAPLYKDEELIRYVKAVNALGGPVTINIGVYQDGTASPATLQQIQKLGHTLGVLK